MSGPPQIRLCRSLKNWPNGDMAMRWCASGLVVSRRVVTRVNGDIINQRHDHRTATDLLRLGDNLGHPSMLLKAITCAQLLGLNDLICDVGGKRDLRTDHLFPTVRCWYWIPRSERRICAPQIRAGWGVEIVNRCFIN
jgi:hypothetical protein